MFNIGNVTTVAASVVNNGVIGAIDQEGVMTARNAAVIENLTGGTISTINNSGTMTGQYGLYNGGAVGSVMNTGVMSSVLNYGTVTGSVGLNNSSLIMAGNSAAVGGVVSWNGEKDGKA
ncbi:hypothetical protein GQQ20_19495, partial [Pantoea agglomerans]|nr:hypothetical protein [Pantoea agglomerans]